jgi:predicted DNA-binding transcriptional regulator AlpA
MEKRLRYADLERLGIVNNRVTLQHWINKLGFPRGQLTGPNSRTWGENEIQAWLDSRPTGLKATPTTKGRHRKAEHAGVEA